MRDEILDLLDRMEDAGPFESQRLAEQISELVREGVAADARRFRALHSHLGYCAEISPHYSAFAGMSLDDLRKWCDAVRIESKPEPPPPPACECDPSKGCGKPAGAPGPSPRRTITATGYGAVRAESDCMGLALLAAQCEPDSAKGPEASLVALRLLWRISWWYYGSESLAGLSIRESGERLVVERSALAEAGEERRQWVRELSSFGAWSAGEWWKL